MRSVRGLIDTQADRAVIRPNRIENAVSPVHVAALPGYAWA